MFNHANHLNTNSSFTPYHQHPSFIQNGVHNSSFNQEPHQFPSNFFTYTNSSLGWENQQSSSWAHSQDPIQSPSNLHYSNWAPYSTDPYNQAQYEGQPIYSHSPQYQTNYHSDLYSPQSEYNPTYSGPPKSDFEDKFNHMTQLILANQQSLQAQSQLIQAQLDQHDRELEMDQHASFSTDTFENPFPDYDFTLNDPSNPQFTNSQIIEDYMEQPYQEYLGEANEFQVVMANDEESKLGGGDGNAETHIWAPNPNDYHDQIQHTEGWPMSLSPTSDFTIESQPPYSTSLPSNPHSDITLNQHYQSMMLHSQTLQAHIDRMVETIKRIEEEKELSHSGPISTQQLSDDDYDLPMIPQEHHTLLNLHFEDGGIMERSGQENWNEETRIFEEVKEFDGNERKEGDEQIPPPESDFEEIYLEAGKGKEVRMEQEMNNDVWVHEEFDDLNGPHDTFKLEEKVEPLSILDHDDPLKVFPVEWSNLALQSDPTDSQEEYVIIDDMILSHVPPPFFNRGESFELPSPRSMLRPDTHHSHSFSSGHEKQNLSENKILWWLILKSTRWLWSHASG